MADITDVKMVSWPFMIPDEKGLHVAFVYVGLDHRKVDPGRFLAGAKRVRLKAMTVTAPFVGHLSTKGSTGARSDLVMRIAAPMVGGLVTSFLMESLVCPAFFCLRHRRRVAAGSPTIPGLAATPVVP